MIVTIKSTSRSTNFGVKDSDTGEIKPKYDNCHDKWVPGLLSTTGVLNTGLTTKQEREFEKQLGYDEYSLAKNGKFWSSFVIVIPENGLVIDTDDALGALYYQLLKADPFIAQNETEAKLKAKVEYIMTSESGIADNSNSRRNIIKKAFATFAKMSQADIVDALFMFGKEGYDISPEIAENRLGEIVESNPKRFNEVMGDNGLKDKVLIKKYIKAGVITKGAMGRGTNVPYYFDDILLGSGIQEVIVFMKAKENNTVALGIKKAYTAALKE